MRDSHRSTVSRKLLQCGLGMEADQIGAQQAIEQSRCHGQMPNASGFGQGMCQKIATRASRPRSA